MAVAIWEWVLLAVLIFLSAFFSAAETALTAVNRVRLRHLAESGNKNALLVETLLKQPNHMLSTILIGNNLVNISSTSLATSIAIRLFNDRGVGIAIAVLTVILLIFAEITPKSYAAIKGDKLALFAVRPLRLFGRLLSPVVKTLSNTSAFLIHLLGEKMPTDSIFITKEEIRTLVDLGEGQGALEPQERSMITNVFELNDTQVHEVMVPRVDIVALSLDASLHEAWQATVDTGHSRIPIYQDSLDQIIGIILAKDLMRYRTNLEQQKTAKIMREPLFVPETKQISELLREMRQTKTHIAVVIDEYGGTAGLAFLEDLVETIVGEIGDEFDKIHPLYEKIGQHEYSFNARIAVDEVNRLLTEDLPQDDFDTLGGLAYHLFGRVPAENEAIVFDELTITIEKVDRNRIQKIRITKK